MLDHIVDVRQETLRAPEVEPRGRLVRGAEPGEFAALVDTLLRCDDVTMTNSAGTLQHAYNRPLPERVPRLWTTEEYPGAFELTWRPHKSALADVALDVLESVVSRTLKVPFG